MSLLSLQPSAAQPQEADEDEKEPTRMYSSGQQALFRKKPPSPMDLTGARLDEIRMYQIPHLREYISDLPRFRTTFARTKISHLKNTPVPRIHWQYITDDEVIIADCARVAGDNHHAQGFLRAGVREYTVWQRGEVKAAIVTCGGLCPGLNDCIEELVNVLYYNYGVDAIFGIRDGYLGFHDPKSWVPLTPAIVEGIHRKGGTILGSTRGGFNLQKIVDSLVTRGINQLYIVGGDGSHRAANEIFREVQRRKLKIVIAAIPKTIDNDIGIIDRSFGFNTAIAEAQHAIISARVEACCTLNGIGIVKLMGRESGMIAAHATIASREVDLCLIPEVPFSMEGANGILAYIDKILDVKGHALVVVSEGAGEDLCGASAGTDPSGNKILPEIGPFLKNCLQKHCKARGITFSIKYHDPSYTIRSVPSTASDSIYCMTLSQNAVHGAMAGFTGFTSALVNNRTVYVPITLITDTSPVYLNPHGRTWERVISSTHQPEFASSEAALLKFATRKPLPSKI